MIRPPKRRGPTPEEPQWISKRAVLAIHELLLAAHGGAAGFIDPALLDSALAAPRNHFEYEGSDVFQLAAAYAYAITQDHPFVDGNKRVAFTVAVVFLERNGYRLSAPEPEAAQIVLDLSAGKANAAMFAVWLRENAQPLASARRTPRSGRTRKRK